MTINVTKPFLPPPEDYLSYVSMIWDRNWLTNNGPLVVKLENDLKKFLGVDNLLYTSNGTTSLQMAIKAAGLTGEVITTPFSYVATTSSLVWENCRPIMVDISPTTLTIDPARIEEAITEHTTGILATHVYGHPCEVADIQRIALKHNLKVIYDAAHAFGVRIGGRSIYEFGDISVASFHATKLFHTIEGGALITRSPGLHESMLMLRNFGHSSPHSFGCLGINGKNSEFHAAMGLCNLPLVPDIIARRRVLSECYWYELANLPVRLLSPSDEYEYNYAYMPAIFNSEATLHNVSDVLKRNNIFPRRYFYPSLDQLPYVSGTFDIPVARDVSTRILCLPLYDSLSLDTVHTITDLIKTAI